MKWLNVRNADEVSSHKMLDLFLGTPPYHLLIYTGIAIPEWDSQSNLDREQVFVNLGQPVTPDGHPITITALIGYTATVGLASIANEDSDFTFATDDVAVSLLPTNELVLVSKIAVQGEPSWLHRFSYQANVIIDANEPLISGTISWTQETASMYRNDNLFTINASTKLPAQGALIAPTKVVAVGEIPGAVVEQNGSFSVPYVIRTVPLNTPVNVNVDIQPGAFSSLNQIFVSQVSGPTTITLTSTHMKQSDVNFELSVYRGPH